MSGGGPSDSDDNAWRPRSSVPKSGGGGGNGGGDVPSACFFTEIVSLASPNIAVVSTLRIGSLLSVSLQEAPLRVVVALGPNIAGSITSARLADIIECIRAGQTYQASVVQISGGLVRLEVSPA